MVTLQYVADAVKSVVDAVKLAGAVGAVADWAEVVTESAELRADVSP
jgi:hypothetical protein